MNFFSNLVFLNTALGWSFIITMTGLLINLLFIAPAFFPILNNSNSQIIKSKNDNSTETLIASIESIRQEFTQFQQSIHSQKKAIDKNLEKVQANFEKRLKDLDKAEQELRKIREDADFYQQVKELSQQQQKLFWELLSRNKRQEYFIGLGLGILSSAIVSAAFLLITETLKNE